MPFTEDYCQLRSVANRACVPALGWPLARKAPEPMEVPRTALAAVANDEESHNYLFEQAVGFFPSAKNPKSFGATHLRSNQGDYTFDHYSPLVIMNNYADFSYSLGNPGVVFTKASGQFPETAIIERIERHVSLDTKGLDEFADGPWNWNPPPRNYVRGGLPTPMREKVFEQPHSGLITLPAASQPTTLMVRNIPFLYTPEELCREWPNNGTYDLLYLPFSNKLQRNLAYAFVNFTSPEAAQEFAVNYHNQRLSRYVSNKSLKISVADVQGRSDNLRRLKKKRLLHTKMAQCQPLVFENGVRIPLATAVAEFAEKESTSGLASD